MTHYPNCWESESHPACRLAEIHRLRAEVSRLESGAREPDWMRRLRMPQGGMVPCGSDTFSGPTLTHPVTLTLHGPGPTWSHASEEPPSR